MHQSYLSIEAIKEGRLSTLLAILKAHDENIDEKS